MRKNHENQLPISPPWPDHQLARELRMISEILDENPSISDLVLQDLCDTVSANNGAHGLTAEQVLRCAIVKQMHPFSYQKLAFHWADSQSFRAFCRLPYGFTPGKSALQENLSKIGDSSWQQINRGLGGWAEKNGLERGGRMNRDALTADRTRYHTDDDGASVLAEAIGINVDGECRLLPGRSRRHDGARRPAGEALRIAQVVGEAQPYLELFAHVIRHRRVGGGGRARDVGLGRAVHPDPLVAG